MEWREDALVLAARPLGERDALVSVLAREQGRHRGVVKGGQGRRQRARLEPGTLVQARWSARLEEHLGRLELEPELALGAALLHDADRLMALAALCGVLEATLPEREPHPALYHATLTVLRQLPGPHWAPAYAWWEVGLLADLGFGLSLERCALSGATDDLAYVSPRTGCAVTAAAGAPWAERLLPLPAFLTPAGGATDRTAVRTALDLTGWFLHRHLFGDRPPMARQRLVDRLR